MVQVGVDQASVPKVSTIAEITFELQALKLPGGYLQFETIEDQERV